MGTEAFVSPHHFLNISGVFPSPSSISSFIRPPVLNIVYALVSWDSYLFFLAVFLSHPDLNRGMRHFSCQGWAANVMYSMTDVKRIFLFSISLANSLVVDTSLALGFEVKVFKYVRERFYVFLKGMNFFLPPRSISYSPQQRKRKYSQTNLLPQQTLSELLTSFLWSLSIFFTDCT